VTALVEQLNHPQTYNARQLPEPPAKAQVAAIAPHTTPLAAGSAAPEAGR
jgi:hypothetical protein